MSPAATETAAAAATETATPTLFGATATMHSTEPQFGRPGCPQCGFDGPISHDDEGDEVAAQHRIEELETQIRGLNEKAIHTAEKLADYEEQIYILRCQAQHDSAQARSDSVSTPVPSTPTPSTATPAWLRSSPPRQQQQQQQNHQQQQPQNRLGAFASFLRSNSPSRPSTSASPAPPAAAAADPGLQDALNREQALRKAAETRLTQANSELEDLTATLFGQANEMVAQERRARAKLEERVEVLERRDGEKRRRLERLEKAIQRVERVRGMVGAM